MDLLTSVEQQRIVIPNSHGENLVGILHETGSKDLERIPMMSLLTALEKEGIRKVKVPLFMVTAAEKLRIYELLSNASATRFLQEQMWCFSMLQKKGTEGRLGKDFLRRIKHNGVIDVKNRKGSYCIMLHFPNILCESSIVSCHPPFNNFVVNIFSETKLENASIDCFSNVDVTCRRKIFMMYLILIPHPLNQIQLFVFGIVSFSKDVISGIDFLLIVGADHEYTSHQDELASVVLDFIRAVREDKNIPEILQSCKKGVKFYQNMYLIEGE
ncbi:uncharacterized protein LOC111300888 [Durio zibethinus]|uniref:Uncharacterized protein LOC111300888 n=1 Tax=Durio zibethinus TaxID=66656 RepID=A0A6P5ZHJ8_DURZI|nr:uncharacterized protein LOC111300888 [Durio zibethinus]